MKVSAMKGKHLSVTNTNSYYLALYEASWQLTSPHCEKCAIKIKFNMKKIA
jgi:hypothetical protein